MQRVRADPLRHGQQGIDIQISPDGMSWLTEFICFIGLYPVQRTHVFGRIDGDSTQAQFVRGSEDTNSDLAAVRDQDLVDQSGTPPRRGQASPHWVDPGRLSTRTNCRSVFGHVPLLSSAGNRGPRS